MKVTFVYPDIMKYRKWSGYYYAGISSLISILKKDGFDVSLLHFTVEPTREDFIDEVNRQNPDVIAFSATTNQYSYVRQWAQWVKQNYDTPIVLGGVHATLDPDSVIQTGFFDYICIGEGEEALLELTRKLENGKNCQGIKNIWMNQASKIYKNEPRSLIQNLDTLPFPDKKEWNYESLERIKDGTCVIMASRGCPYNCSYCCNHALKKLYPGQKYARFRSVDNVLEEIDEVKEQFPSVKKIHFDDDIFILNKNWFKEFSEKYKKRINLPFSCNVRADLITEEMAVVLKEAGCGEAIMGIESGNEFILNEVLKRNLSVAQIRKACEILHDHGIKISAYNMVGLPFEDMRKYLDTVKLNASLPIADCRLSVFYPYRGSKIYELCKREGFVLDRNATDYKSESCMNYPYITKTQVNFCFRFFKRLVPFYSFLNKHPGKVSRSIKKIVEFLLYKKLISIPLCSLVMFIHKRLKSIESFLYFDTRNIQ